MPMLFRSMIERVCHGRRKACHRISAEPLREPTELDRRKLCSRVCRPQDNLPFELDLLRGSIRCQVDGVSPESVRERNNHPLIRGSGKRSRANFVEEGTEPRGTFVTLFVEEGVTTLDPFLIIFTVRGPGDPNLHHPSSRVAKASRYFRNNGVVRVVESISRFQRRFSSYRSRKHECGTRSGSLRNANRFEAETTLRWWVYHGGRRWLESCRAWLTGDYLSSLRCSPVSTGKSMLGTSAG